LKNIFFGIGDWGLGIGPNPQSPIPNPQLYGIIRQIDYYKIYYNLNYFKNLIK